MPLHALEPEDPRRLGRWKLEGRLGAGGMGVVYLARDAAGRPAAVKLLHSALLTDPEAVARFRREARVLQRVAGQCTARMLDADLAGDRPYVVCEFIDGPTLAEHVARHGPLPDRDLHAFALGLAEALVAIHDADVVHRDLSAGNVMLTSAGPKVVDFGIARHLDMTDVTRSGVILGTPRWMAPEQARGDPPSPSSDVFAWGALVAFAASGQSPFGTGSPDALLYRVVHEPPDLPPLPDPLDRLVAAALTKDPEGRPAAGQLVEQLLAATGDADVTDALERTWTLTPTPDHTGGLAAPHAPPEPDAGQPAERHGRLPRRRVLAGAILVLLAAAGALGVIDRRGAVSPPAEQPVTAATPIPTGEPALTPTPTAAPTGDAAAEDEEEDAEQPEPEEELGGTPPGEPPRPQLPTAPWDAPAVAPPEGQLREIADLWREEGFPDCALHAPTEIESELGYEPSFMPEFTQLGDFQFGWEDPAGDGFVGVFVMPLDYPTVSEYIGEEPRVYVDGSEMYFGVHLPVDSRLIAIPGQECFYEISAGSNATMSWTLESFRRIATE